MNRCPTCPRLHNPVMGDGPAQSRVVIIGERPGRDENKSGRPFMGQSGQELNLNYLPLAGLDRDDVYITNAVKCFAEQNKKPTEAEIQSCAGHFVLEELLNVGPDVVVLAGASACQLAGEVDLEAQHGIPFRGEVLGYETWVVPMYHPAAGLHKTTLMIDMLEDWERLKLWLSDPIEHVERVGSKRDYRLGRTADEVRQYFIDYPINEYMGGDTESHAGKDFSIQVTTHIGTGLMVLFEDTEAMHELKLTLMIASGSFFDATLVLHNAESDLDQFERLIGSKIQYVDTQQMAYHLQNLPQGLKALSYRLLGRKRQSWKELVGGYSRSALVDWLWQARELVEENFRTEIAQVSALTGKPIKPKVIKSPLEGFFKRLIQHTNKPQSNPDKPYDPWAQLRDYEWTVQDLQHMDKLIGHLGEVPQLGIRNCPLDVARDYGCSDSDDALAVAMEIIRLKREAMAGWAVAEGDWDRQHLEMQP